ncbi:MAG TPA: hypothetical protein VEX88_04285 [Glaciibacter sp.]|nr:hypothetical protein [Glaciibacter sp.]
MTESHAIEDAASSPGRRTCPPWCNVRHGISDGEEDWVHVSEPLVVADEVDARLCMSVDPETEAKDGPYVVVGSREYSLTDAERLGASLIELASRGASPTPPGAA